MHIHIIENFKVTYCGDMEINSDIASEMFRELLRKHNYRGNRRYKLDSVRRKVIDKRTGELVFAVIRVTDCPDRVHPIIKTNKKRIRWTQQELDDLIALIHKYSRYPRENRLHLVIQEHSQNYPYRSRDSIYLKVYKLAMANRISMNKHFDRKGGWTKQEEEIIQRYYATSTKKQLMKMLPGRTWNSIMVRAHILGVKRSVPERYKTVKITFDTDLVFSAKASKRSVPELIWSSIHDISLDDVRADKELLRRYTGMGVHRERIMRLPLKIPRKLLLLLRERAEAWDTKLSPVVRACIRRTLSSDG